jgi:hypothetical protein
MELAVGANLPRVLENASLAQRSDPGSAEKFDADPSGYINCALPATCDSSPPTFFSPFFEHFLFETYTEGFRDSQVGY